ncbi:hypothetical protein EZS27_008878 [termite gut metagenome]|uniref:Uncharacterized protein n=1 Tax=termite gut metagenome TaxID=433724 RepID=A0A5J4SC22_9ZZZZ
MKSDNKPYNIIFVQKSSPKKSDDFLFVNIYKFFTDRKLKYTINQLFKTILPFVY